MSEIKLMEKVEKEYQYRETIQLTVVRKESLIRHEDLIRREKVLKDIQGKQEWDDHNRSKV